MKSHDKYWSNVKQNIIRGIFRTCVLWRRVDWYRRLSLLQSPLLCFHYRMPTFFREAEFSRINLTMEVTSSSEMLMPIYQSTKCRTPQEWYICQHCFEKFQWHEFLFRDRMATDWLNIIQYEFMFGQMTNLPIPVDDWLTDVLTSIVIRCLMNFQLTRLITDWIIGWLIKLCP